MSSNTSLAQTLRFCNEGLDSIHVNEKLSSAIKNELHDIDTSTLDGELEYGRFVSPAWRNESYTCKKLTVGRYSVQGLGNISNMYIAYTKDSEIVKEITIDYSDYDESKVKELLTKEYGKHDLEVNTGWEGASFISYVWTSSSGLDIYLSGIGGSIKLRYINKNKTKEY